MGEEEKKGEMGWRTTDKNTTAFLGTVADTDVKALVGAAPVLVSMAVEVPECLSLQAPLIALT